MAQPSLYGSKWQRERATFLASHPLCQCPQCDEGRLRVRAATVVDHKIPHRNDLKLFWRRSNWQALAKQCHDSWKQQLEKTGAFSGASERGIPLDPNHHWRRGGAG